MGRGQRPELKAAWSPEVPGSVSLTLCPQATVVLGLAVSWHACLPACQRPCHGARVPGLGQVAELLGGVGGWSRSSQALQGGGVGELCSQGGRWHRSKQHSGRLPAASPGEQRQQHGHHGLCRTPGEGRMNLPVPLPSPALRSP